MRKLLKARPNGGEYLQFVLRVKIWQGKSPSVSSAETGKRQKNIMEFPELQQSTGEAPLVQHTPWRL